MTDPEGLKDLLVAASSGDRAAFARLYGLTAPRLHGIALRILRQEDLAADALRAAFVRLWHEAASLAGEDDILTLMVARVRREALDAARARAESGLSLEPFEVEEEVEDPLASDVRSPELGRLLSCLGQLSEERRRMVLHAYYDGWSKEALSIYCDAPPHAVNTWIWRSIAELDVCLGP
ncbi:sigma factor-like helix-turn-helix DNA-binding protein [Aquabacter sp. CN5-332]|uniref:sigma factor-like helix-turn-helix DNA-binding protein n=1 Tax=Aquabacter sp. CN5-332 TaxID=3156608 RepID=UPI0032B55FC7